MIFRSKGNYRSREAGAAITSLCFMEARKTIKTRKVNRCMITFLGDGLLLGWEFISYSIY